jgi:hypothetical protein
MTRLTPESNPVKLFCRILRQYDVNVGVLNGVNADFGRKKFYNIGSRGQCYKTFYSVIYEILYEASVC